MEILALKLVTGEDLLGEVEFIRKHIDLVCLGIIFISVVPVIIGIFKNKKGSV